ncbi:MAG: hypothetical protein ACPGRE_10030, partial [Flavobacteriaceae bacterium]
MHLIKRGLLLGVLITGSITMTQCKMYKDPEDTQTMAAEAIPTDVEVPEFWELSTNPSDTTQVAGDWYREFHREELNALVEEALDTTNLAILMQLAKIDFSSAGIRFSKSGKNV